VAARQTIEITTADGKRTTALIDGDFLAANVGDTASGRAHGTAYTFINRKGHAYLPNVAVGAGITIRVVRAFGTCFLVIVEQSNGEGRAPTTDADQIVNATRVAPNDYPYDENMSGPGAPNIVGPGLFFCDALLSDPRFPFQRMTICCTATGNNSLSDRYGTDGTDGNFATQANDREVLGGPIATSLEPCLIQPGDSYILWMGGGEADASSGTTTGWAAEWTVFKDYIVDTYLAGANCLAIVVPTLGDTAAGGATQERQDIVVAEQLSLHAPQATPPIITAKYEDSDRQAGDLIHYSAAGQKRVATQAANDLLDLGVFD
jgi:hypothetical protein